MERANHATGRSNSRGECGAADDVARPTPSVARGSRAPEDFDLAVSLRAGSPGLSVAVVTFSRAGSANGSRRVKRRRPMTPSFRTRSNPDRQCRGDHRLGWSSSRRGLPAPCGADLHRPRNAGSAFSPYVKAKRETDSWPSHSKSRDSPGSVSTWSRHISIARTFGTRRGVWSTVGCTAACRALAIANGVARPIIELIARLRRMSTAELIDRLHH
jgi:hypothetical protein